jgi:ubiquinone/menaquinone biosynthesis C-methylase UbiE
MGIRERIETAGLRLLSRPGRTSRFRGDILDKAGVGPDTNVIDVATAVGGMAFAAKERTGSVVAIDISKERIGIAKSDPRARGIDFRVMDAASTGFADKQFDVAINVLGLHEMTVDGARAALAETRRIAKRMVVVEFGVTEWPLFWRIFKYVLGIIEPEGFFAFMEQDVGEMIETAGWRIERREKSFPLVTYICS